MEGTGSRVREGREQGKEDKGLKKRTWSLISLKRWTDGKKITKKKGRSTKKRKKINERKIGR